MQFSIAAYASMARGCRWRAVIPSSHKKHEKTQKMSRGAFDCALPDRDF
jgi:hypothetical protein